ncbi:unnamed protein product [Tuber aestivum]|uniref:Uncharacterized protein n=1 Tax=Tuber aestivum TaxID=59557 RepID=A0A292PZD4_9PEZI|nr:unnamed protein product [Tuber aestivum]
MAEQILWAIKRAMQTGSREFLINKHSDLTPAVSTQILDSLSDKTSKFYWPGCRVQFLSPTGYLKVIMPTHLHECPTGWLRQCLNLWYAQQILRPEHTARILDNIATCTEFEGKFAGSVKTPDVAFTPVVEGKHYRYPSVVLESGWRESRKKLLLDGDLWNTGTLGAVRVVLLCKAFTKNRGNRVGADLTMCRNLKGGEICRRKISIFPVPEAVEVDPFITVDELFAGSCPMDLDPETHLLLPIQNLRTAFKREILACGKRPA